MFGALRRLARPSLSSIQQSTSRLRPVSSGIISARNGISKSSLLTRSLSTTHQAWLDLGRTVGRANSRLDAFEPIFTDLARGSLISLNDLQVGMKRALPNTTITDEQIERMFRIGDLDSSGRIDFEEFITLFEDIPDGDISIKSLAERWIGYAGSGTTIQDPEMIFLLAWRQLVVSSGGEEKIRLPREIMFLGGAPGAGKGTMTPYIMRERGLDNQPIVMSSFLNSPAAKKIIDEGGLVSDMEVFAMLLGELAKPEQFEGCLVDGFPRTVIQVELLQLLHDKMMSLSRPDKAILADLDERQPPTSRSAAPLTTNQPATACEWKGPRIMPRPHFRMCILYVDEHESIQRQLARGRAAIEHNKLVAESGEGELQEVRETDLSVKAAKRRFQLFVEGTMAANEALKRSFPYNLINASGSISEVKSIVMQELAYQSSLELAEDTYNAIRHIPTAAEITRHARQNLVARLDGYQREHPETFSAVVEVIDGMFLPAIRRHALVGEARVAVTAPNLVTTFNSEPLSMGMAVDVMFDRGFALRVEERGVRADGGASEYRFKITFPPPKLSNVASLSGLPSV